MPSTKTKSSLPVAMVMPNPVECPEMVTGDASSLRNLYCPQYGSCLEFAARKGWRNLSCRECALDVGTKGPGATQWAEARIRRD